MLRFAGAQCPENLATASEELFLFEMSQAPSNQSPTGINGASLQGSALHVVNLVAEQCL